MKADKLKPPMHLTCTQCYNGEPKSNLSATITKLIIYAKGKCKQKNINKDYAPDRRMRCGGLQPYAPAQVSRLLSHLRINYPTIEHMLHHKRDSPCDFFASSRTASTFFLTFSLGPLRCSLCRCSVRNAETAITNDDWNFRG